MNPDITLEELREIGVPRWLMEIAAEHSVPVAIDVWRRLSEEAQVGDGRSRLYVPAWTVYLRYQRNRFIKTLDAEQVPPEDIVKTVKDVLCERISLCHVRRIVRG